MQPQNQRNNEESNAYETDLNELRASAKLTGHSWKQQGPLLICDSCPIQHSTFIGTKLYMTGMDKEGNPVLEKR